MIDTWIKDILGQLTSWPNEAILFAAIIAVGYAVKAVEFIPNKFIPLIGLSVGITGEILMGSTGAVSPEVIHPQVRLGATGAVIWLVAWLTHAQLLKRLEPAVKKAVDKGTEFFTKPKAEEPPKP